MKVDLHIHTTASDGALSPQEVVRLAAKKGLSVVAITDHDSVAGIAAAKEEAQAFPSLRLIPGVEINTDIPNGEVHILGYFIDYESEELKRTLEALRHSREIRAQKMIAKLGELGIQVEWQRIQELAGGGSVGRPHIAQAMWEQGYVPSLQEAFTKYIGRNGPAYAERERLSPEEAVKLVVRAGGLPVLAHPADTNDLEKFVVKLKEVGLVGLEAYYDGYGRKTIHQLVQLASKYGLLTSGGSDFHGLAGDEMPIGGIDVPLDCARRLIALAEQREKAVTR